ncbi:MAG: alkaline phosphatase family protein [Solirubrobacterales bacterium]|nr:alkaline phosphatase family protein [Solirubrobacterales bacterium]
MPEKLVLVVVDALHPAMLQRAIDDGSAPTFAALAERGKLVRDCVSSFPSVTPVACSEMLTGVGPGDHWVMGMNWYHRLESRYIEYGSSFEATRVFGLFRAMYDLVYNMNLGHLSWEQRTVFESLGDAGVRTACTPFLIFRGRSRHEVSLEGLTKRALGAVNFRHAVWAPDEFFYGDVYASRETECVGNFGRPGTRDDYAACVSEELVRDGAYDFLLFALPDNDFYSHRHGPDSSDRSIARADEAFARIVEAGGGFDAFLRENAVIVTGDHAQTEISDGLPLVESLSEDWRVLQPNEDQPENAEIAVSPTSRAGAVYMLEDPRRRPVTQERLRAHLREMDGVDLVAWLSDADGMPVTREGVGLGDADAVEAVVERDGRELRFRPGGLVRDRRGARWKLRGDAEALDADVSRGRFDAERYPDALARLWSALVSPHAGDLLISAADGYECVDWGGVTHIGGGSHGSLARDDSLTPLLFVGCGPEEPASHPQWALRDLSSVILEHFGLFSDGGRREQAAGVAT